MNTTSTAKVSKDVIIQAAKNFNIIRKNAIFNIQEPYIQKAMQLTFWQKLFNKPSRNREEAYEHCIKELYWNGFSTAEDYAYNTMQRFTHLINLINLSKEDYIHLSAEDASIVNHYKDYYAN